MPATQSHPAFHTSARSTVAALGATLALVTLGEHAQAQWNVVSLHPPGATASVVYSNRNGQQAGAVNGIVGRWTGTAASFVGFASPGNAWGTDSVEQVGYEALLAHAGSWMGGPGTFVDLDPGMPSTRFSIATGVHAGIESGYWVDTNFVAHGGIWTGTAASWIDLSPAGASASGVEGVFAAQETGWAVFPSGVHAGVWYNTAASWVDLHPAGANESRAFGVYNSRQAGFAVFPLGTRHASVWSSTPGSWIDLHPAAADLSEAHSVYNSYQAGWASLGGVNHASFWANSPSSWTDLHVFLPPNYSESAAYSVWANGAGVAQVVGNAYNTTTGQYEAFMWVQTVPGTNRYCFGDTTGTPCPCGNDTSANSHTGCRNSLGTGGGLVSMGTASIASDSLKLIGFGMTNSSALYFQGTAQVGLGLGVAFGDGLRCAGGSIVRLSTTTNVGFGSMYPFGGNPSVSVKGNVTSPGTRNYQVWYRNSDLTFCTPSTFNLTSALSVPWAP